MDKLANNLLETIKDYRNDDGVQLKISDIINWANQFGDKAEFVLNEINHLMPKVYVSKIKAREFVFLHIEALMKSFKYSNVSQFLAETEFLDLQLPHKSQPAILSILEGVLNEKFSESYIKYKSYPKINFVYFDDILATGSTIGKHLVDWLNATNADGHKNIDNVLNNSYKLSVNLFCYHTWGHSFQKFRLKKEFNDKLDTKIQWFRNFEIENHLKFNNQSLNIAIPTENQPTNVKSYLANLSAEKYEDYAYRKEENPINEGFFTSSENRILYENLILEKGLLIIDKIQGELKPNIRPLGLINPNYKTFGLGTHFFTWRNIPNNSPLVFWWEVEGHNWIPLFPVANRG